MPGEDTVGKTYEMLTVKFLLKDIQSEHFVLAVNTLTKYAQYKHFLFMLNKNNT